MDIPEDPQERKKWMMDLLQNYGREFLIFETEDQPNVFAAPEPQYRDLRSGNLDPRELRSWRYLDFTLQLLRDRHRIFPDQHVLIDCPLHELHPLDGEEPKDFRKCFQLTAEGTIKFLCRRSIGCKRKHCSAKNNRYLDLYDLVGLLDKKVREHGLTWLLHAPRIKLFPEDDPTRPHPLSWDEERHLLDHLPGYLRSMVLFEVNTGTRDQEVCNLRWEWEEPISELNTSVFIIPGPWVKNGQECLVVLNRIAAEVVEGMRGIHHTHVFSCNGHPVSRMYNRAWMKARMAAGLPDLRVHDLKHTFGRRLRAEGVCFEDRQDLLGHKSSRITTDYSRPETAKLMEAANRVCGDESRKSPARVILRTKAHLSLVG